ncbi:phage portal protein, SPP1 family [Enterococcus hirae]|nr:phage portal protein, SPP1 family [Enterococcus hirae]
MTYLKPTQGFIVYADDLLKAPMFAVLYNKMTKDELTATVYPQNSTETFIFTKDKTSKRLEPKQGLTVFQKVLSYLLGGKEAITNPYGDVPMIEFMENDERQGRIESVWSLINNYNEALSEKANDVSYFADAYLKMIGVDLNDKNVAAFLRDNRVINSADPLNEGETVDINFLDKPSSDATQENLLDRLERLIYQMSSDLLLIKDTDEDTKKAVDELKQIISKAREGIQKELLKGQVVNIATATKETDWRSNLAKNLEKK